MKNRARNSLLLVTILAVAALVIDQATAIRPGTPPEREGSPEPARPKPGDLPFQRAPIAPTYAERRQMFIDWAVSQPTPDERGGILVDLVKLDAGAIDHPADGPLQKALDFVNAREDPSDFTVAELVRVYFLHHADGKLTPAQEKAIHQALLNFKYWFDQPGTSLTEMWTENHQVLSHGSEYLAGQMFPEETFYDGKTGREHQQHARELLLRWFDFHARTGMGEWDSIPYYNMDIAALLNLVEFAGEPEIQQRATMMVDLLLFDAVVDSFYGQYGTSHGRATAGTIRSAAGDSLLTLQTLLFGPGRIQSIDMATTMLVTGRRYQVPPVLEAIALDHPDELVNYERQSIPVTDQSAAQYGYRFDDLKNIDIWWGMGAFTHPKVIDLTVRAADTYQLWNYPDFADLKDVAQVLKRLGLLSLASRLLNPDSNGVVTSEVNKITYRTPDAMLSTAQSYRPGEKGYQQHIWQATLSPYAVVLVTNPDSLRTDDSQRPSYWASNGRMPRTAQYKNVLVSIFNIDRHPSLKLFEPRHYGFTHAYFPKWAFDEVREVPVEGAGGWVFGRAGDGYVALYSRNPYYWTTSGPDADQEIAAPGLQNIWICQVGRRAVDGSFDSFIQAVSAAQVNVEGLDVTYLAPGVGEVSFGWNGDFKINAQPVPLNQYPRWDNPYTHAEFGQSRFQIEFDGKSLELDFDKAERKIQ